VARRAGALPQRARDEGQDGANVTTYARLALTFVTLAIPVVAQDGAPAPIVRKAVPFSVGERAEYSLKYGILHAGVGLTEVVAVDSVRGREAWHTVFRVRGGIPGFRVDDRFESWMDVASLASLRHWQSLDEGPNERERKYEIFPERGVYIQGDQEPQPTVETPLDDGSFIYFLRTIPLEVGVTYEFNQYFRPDRNPVRIVVLRRERIRVPAGTFNTIVVRPIIKTRGVFAENGRAEVWLSDDPNRLMIQMKTHVKFGTLALYLKSYRPGVKPDSTRADSTRRDTTKRDTTKRDTTKPDTIKPDTVKPDTSTVQSR
jgi:hypothetical protein